MGAGNVLLDVTAVDKPRSLSKEAKLPGIALEPVHRAALWPQEDAKGPLNIFIEHDAKTGKKRVNVKSYW